MKFPALAARRLPVRALLREPGAAVALLDRRGLVLECNEAFTALAGAGPALHFAEPAATEVAAAVTNEQTLRLETSITSAAQSCNVGICLTPTGQGAPAFMLRLTDLRPVLQLQAQLAQAQRLQSVGFLAAGIAHDFNNLLTAIIGAADALIGQVAADGAADLAQIRASADRGAALVQQLLAFGGQQTLQPRVLQLNDAVRHVAGLLARLLGSQIKLQLELDEPGRAIRIDPTQLDRVLINLVCNARDAMPDGGTLTIATGRRVLLAAETEGGDTLPPGRYATIDVRDTGAGIPAAVLPHIFEPFFTTRRGAGGTGLGLSSVHGIIRQSGGTLSVESVAGEGACFRITLPRYEPPPGGGAAAPMPAEAETAPASGKRVLLVDDEAPIRRLAARALTRAGWDVLEAASAEEALEMDLGAIGLVISDVMMPGLDGPGLVAALREHTHGLRAILMSGYADAARRRALQAADIAFLAKPFGMDALVGEAGKQAGLP